MQSCGFIPFLCGQPLQARPKLLPPLSSARGPATSSGGDRRGCGRYELAELGPGPRVSAWKSCGFATLWEAWRGGRRHRIHRIGLRRCTCPRHSGPRCLCPPCGLLGQSTSLRSPVPQGNLESILQTPGGSPPRLSEAPPAGLQPVLSAEYSSSIQGVSELGAGVG